MLFYNLLDTAKQFTRSLERNVAAKGVTVSGCPPRETAQTVAVFQNEKEGKGEYLLP